MGSLKTSISVCIWNSRGSTASIPYSRQLFEKCDFLCICEHWLHANRYSQLDEISTDIDYIARSSRFSSADEYGSVRGQGGVAILWNKNLKGVTPIRELVHDRICGVQIQTDTDVKINIFCVYVPAKGGIEKPKETLDELAGYIEIYGEGSINVIAGDFNGDIGNLDGTRSKAAPTKEGKVVYGYMKELNLVAVNMQGITTGPVDTFNSYMGSSCIDYIMVPEDIIQNVRSCIVLENEVNNTSDHDPIVMDMKISGCLSSQIPNNKVGRIKWDKLDFNTVNLRYRLPVHRDLVRLIESSNIEDPSVEEIDSYTNSIVKILKGHEKGLPHAHYRKNLKPYWCEELSELKRVKVKCFKEWRDAGRPRDRENPLRIRNLEAKKNFKNRLKKISKEHEEKKIYEAVQTSELDRKEFWRILKRVREEKKANINTVRNKDEKIVSDPVEILEVWRNHFSSLCTPKDQPRYDRGHFEHVTNSVAEYMLNEEYDQFTEVEFERWEIQKGISKLNSGKVPGDDGVTKENLVAGGEMVVEALYFLFKCIIKAEYIPKNFRMGVQVPLYKGKNASTLDTNNYRGITLLNTLNKLFEVILWGRMQVWWEGERVISGLQGACRKKVSCVHTAMVHQETISAQLEAGKTVFVAYYDVSKAFDGIWTDGLFYRLHALGIRGRTWRLLYKSYIDFKCKVRIHDMYSQWYNMSCGIHQGGYMSLIKYIAFIDSLLVELEASDLCCSIAGLSTSPLGYADDMTTASISKMKADRAIDLVYAHSCKWRYQLNAKKCAVLVYGEKPSIKKKYSKYRQYKMGTDRVVEKITYDHVGLKNCSNGCYLERTEEKISKARKALCAISGIGFKPGGVTMRVCDFIFSTVIIPILTFAAELWVLKEQDIEALDNFQRYAARKFQRFSKRTPRETSVRGLGWMRIENFIYAKKVIFIRSICVLEEGSMYKDVLQKRCQTFNTDVERHSENVADSPIFEMLKCAILYGLYQEVLYMINIGCQFSKQQWSSLVWERAWSIENSDRVYSNNLFQIGSLLNEIMGERTYLIWWEIADENPALMQYCEVMAKIICRTSRLKSDDYNYKDQLLSGRSCDMCEQFIAEDVKHIVLECDGTRILRMEMFDCMYRVSNMDIVAMSDNILHTLLGKNIEEVPIQDMMEVWKLSCRYISRMYWKVVANRSGIG